MGNKKFLQYLWYNSITYGTPNIIKVNIDAIWTALLQPDSHILPPVVDGGRKAQIFFQSFAFLIRTADPDHSRTAVQPADLQEMSQDQMIQRPPTP